MDAEARKKLSKVVKLERGDLSFSAFGRLLGAFGAAVQYWEKGEVIPDMVADVRELTQINVDMIYPPGVRGSI
ncbi:hypothetical protein [Microcoleus sp. Pol12A5]|uniref:hypothetical protein n=1 Tax=Microcoleus sp. Pol12A5 TaxID=3055392 RepID=UPI002FD7490C